MSTRPLLGEFVDENDPRTQELLGRIKRLERDNGDLRAQLNIVQSRLLAAEKSAAASLIAMEPVRHQLTPLYQALQRLFGDFDTAGVTGESSSPASNNPSALIWDSWKRKLGGKSADLIDALMHHGTMNALQLRVAMKCHINNVYKTTAKLQSLGLLDKDGGKYSLKELHNT